MTTCNNALCPLSDSCARHEKHYNYETFPIHHVFTTVSGKPSCDDHLQKDVLEFTMKDFEVFAEWLQEGFWWKSTDSRYPETLGLWSSKTINGDFPKETGKTTGQLVAFFLYTMQQQGKMCPKPVENNLNEKEDETQN